MARKLDLQRWRSGSPSRRPVLSPPVSDSDNLPKGISSSKGLKEVVSDHCFTALWVMTVLPDP